MIYSGWRDIENIAAIMSRERSNNAEMHGSNNVIYILDA